MSTPANDAVPLHRPKPRRPFELTPLTSMASEGLALDPKLDFPPWASDEPLTACSSSNTSSTNGSTTPIEISKRTKSMLNMTASTLFGIYSHTYGDEPPTPSRLSRANSVVNVADTISLNGSSGAVSNDNNYYSKENSERQHKRKPTSVSRLIMRLSALFIFGIGYGIIVMQLHNTKTFTPAWWEEIGGYNIGFLSLWGIVGVILGSLLPWIDYFLDEPGCRSVDRESEESFDWVQIVRSIGAFVGIAYAIRKLPWESTLQVSLTLSLVNPFLWYLVDRTRTGFWVSAFVGLIGTIVLWQINPEMLQAPETYTGHLVRGVAGVDKSEEMLLGYITYETVEVGTWMLSLLFCSCVCFGNIGRKFFREGGSVV